MEISELKEIWREMDQKLAHQNSLQMALLREKKLGSTRSKLKPLFWGMAVQLLFGLVSVLYSAPFWVRNLDTPVLWINGLIVHAYGLIIMVLAGAIMFRINRIDVSAPVLEIQKQIVELKKSYIKSGWIAGLPWWVLWLPYTIVVSHEKFGLFAEGLPTPFIGIFALCTLGLFLTLAAVMWARNPKRPELAAKTEAMLAGVSLTNAQQSLNDLLRFEQQEGKPEQ